MCVIKTTSDGDMDKQQQLLGLDFPGEGNSGMPWSVPLNPRGHQWMVGGLGGGLGFSAPCVGSGSPLGEAG